MRVRWTTDAADDLERICDYIAQDRPEAARRVALSVVERIGTLEAFPRLGRSGRVLPQESSPSLHSLLLQSMKCLKRRTNGLGTHSG
jgi:plasmid stabilization system protein ParE